MAKIKELVVKVLKEEVKIFQSRLERWDEEVEDGLWKTSGVTGLQAAIDVIESRIDKKSIKGTRSIKFSAILLNETLQSAPNI